MEYYLSNLERIRSWYEKLSCSIETGPVHRYCKKPTGPHGFYLSDCIRDENGRERVRKPFNASISILYYEKREPKRNNRECERNGMYGQRKWAEPKNLSEDIIVHLLCMNITQHTCKLSFLKNMIKASCFLWLNVKCIDQCCGTKEDIWCV